jgi:hypothetical protein
MNEVGMEIIIDAKMQGVIAGLNTVQKELAQTAVASAKVDSAFDKANSGIKKTGTNFTGLSRILQDLPFGFIGIQNNITQLLPAAGALGLAISAVTAAITFSQVGFSAWTRGLNNAKEQTDKTKEALDGYNESAAKEIIKLNELIIVAKDEGQSRNVRLAAVQKLKAEYPNYLKGLSDEQILAGQLGTSYDKINQALLAKVALQAADDKIIPLIKQQVDLSLQLQKVNRDLDLQRQEGTATGFKSHNTLSKALLDDNKTLTEHNSLLAQQTVLQNKINAIQKEFSGLLRITAPLDFVFKPDNKKVEKDIFASIEDFDFTKAFLKIQQKAFAAFSSINLFNARGGQGLPEFKLPEITQPLTILGDEANKKVTNNFIRGLQETQDEIKKTADAVQNILAPAFDTAFSAIAQGKNVFKAVEDGVKSLVLELVKAAVESAIIAVIMNIIFPGSSGVTGGFAGIFGKLTGLGNLFPHADGGIITKPLVAGSHLFGEAGKEAVIPLDRINDYLRPSSQSDGLVMTHAIRGDDLLLILNRANRSAGRNK